MKASAVNQDTKVTDKFEQPWIKPELDITVSSDLNYKSSSHNRLKYFQNSAKIPLIDLPHGMKNILFMVHKNKQTKQFADKRELSDYWFEHSSTLYNTGVYEQWKSSWLNQKLKNNIDDEQKVMQIFRDR